MTFYNHIALLSVVALLLTAQLLSGQSVLARKISFDCYDCTPAEALVRLSRETSVNISFANGLVSGCGTVRIKAIQQPLGAVIRDITRCVPVKLHAEQSSVAISRRTLYHTLSGHVTDVSSGERLIGSTIYIHGEGSDVSTTNEFGYFSLQLAAGEYWVSFQSVGYEGTLQKIYLTADREIEVNLKNISRLPEIVIPGESPGQRSGGHKSGVQYETLSKERLRLLPMPGGQSDVVRQAALMSGIQSGVDGLGGLHVRGGNADQNLLLLDDVPVYNAGHALGLFSIFNPAISSSNRLWKGSIPARYGGRVSSVLDVRTRDGDQSNYHAQLSAGTFATGLTVEGPVLRNKSAFLAGVRATYLDPWIQALSQKDNVLIDKTDSPFYRFFDAHFKLHYNVSKKDRLYLSFYNGGDNFYNRFVQDYNQQGHRLRESIRLDSEWGNTIAALRWNHIFHDRIFVNTTLRYSHFAYESKQNFLIQETDSNQVVHSNLAQAYKSFIRDWSVKTDFIWWSRKYHTTLRWGGAYTLHDFRPGVRSVNFKQENLGTVNLDSLFRPSFNRTPGADEGELYAETDWQPNARWGAEAGLYCSFFLSGPAVYVVPQPRFVLRHRFDNGWEQWLGLQRTAQNLHQVGSYSISLPFELWVPSTVRVPPQIARQVSLGTRWEGSGWEAGIEAYYKRFDRVITFLSFGNFLSDNFTEEAAAWEDRIAIGTGEARGLEFNIEKHGGNLTGAVAYTLSKADRHFDEINNRRPFPFRFDRRHDFKIQLVQQLDRHYSLGAVWVWASGNPMTLAGVKYRQQTGNASDQLARDIKVYSEVNGYRLPPYHRLDLTFSARFQRGKRLHLFQIGGYNVYNRANPFYVAVNTNAVEPGKGKQFTLLPFLPILRYELHL